MEIRNCSFTLLLLLALIACRPARVGQEKSDRTRYFPKSTGIVEKIPRKENVWVFILAGQSNMAGRGFVEPKDTLPTKRVLTITARGQLVYAKEPLHFYEPVLTGLDCGLSFGKHLVKKIPDSVSVLLIPTAVGGSSISQWLGDSLHRDVQLLSNFREKVKIGKQYGQIKAVLWHQGESDANVSGISHYNVRISALVERFREITGNESLPILIGELGSFSQQRENWLLINKAVQNYRATHPNTIIIPAADLKDKGDKIHFNSKGQRILGQRFAKAYIQHVNRQP